MTFLKLSDFLRVGAVALAVAAISPVGASLPTETEPVDSVTTVGLSSVVSPVDSYVTSTLVRDTDLTYSLLAKDAPTTSTEDDDLEFDPATMLRVEDLRPGTIGYGLSVFSGIRPERFEAELVGVRHRVFADMDIILCRLTHPILKDIGVVAGMSGSPVYMDGKLIGAVAYGWTDSKEALAGVTPIDHMLKVYKSTPTTPINHDSEEATGEAATYSAYQAYMDAWQSQRMEDFARALGMNTSSVGFEVRGNDLPAEVRSRYSLPDRMEMRPLTAPMFVTGASPRTMDLMRQVFRGMEFQATDGMQPVSTWVSSAPAENSPGGPVPDLQVLADELDGGYGLAVPFVEGDLNMAGIGTISYRKGSRLVAFGHPMFEQGLVRFPMAPARVNAIVRSSVRPFKVGESLGQVGMIRQDRQPAVGGLFGQTADMFEVNAVVTDPRYRGTRDFKYRVWNDRDMAPRLAMTVLAESMVASARSGGDSVALYKYTLNFDDGTAINREDYLSDQYGGLMAAMGTSVDIGMMMTNPYKRVKPVSVDFQVQVADRFAQARILAAAVDKTVFRPGETVTAEWEVQPYRKPLERMQYSFNLPETLPNGEYDLQITDATARDRIEGRRNPAGDRIFDYQSLVNILQRHFPSNKVYVTLQDRDTGVAVRGREMPKLPSSIINTVQDTVESTYFAPIRGNFLVDADVASTYEINGTANASFTVRRQLNE